MVIEHYYRIEVDDRFLAEPEAVLIGYFDSDPEAYAVSLVLCGGGTWKIRPDGFAEVEFEAVDRIEPPEAVIVF